MSLFNLLMIALATLGVALVAVEIYFASRKSESRLAQAARIGLALAAIINIVLVVFLVLNQIGFPLHLDLMEGVVLQHFQRAANGEPIYPEPSPAYAPLAYNGFFYVFSVPFSWVFGVNLPTLRLVSLLGMLGSGLVIFRVVQEKTRSLWWGLIGAGLFAAAYGAMDAYLNTAHSDSWLLFSALLGAYLIDRDRSRAWNIAGLVLLVAAFWFKQHGALFAIGGVAFLTWRELGKAGWINGLRRSIPYWIVAILLGPALYIFAGPALFGSHFHYFTWEVPRNWTELNLSTFVRYGKFIARNYFFLALAGGLLVLWAVIRDRKRFDMWHTFFVFACLSGFMGALDPGSSDNVFIPMGAAFILLGVMGLHELSVRVPVARQYRLYLLALFFSFALLLYDPRPFVTSPQAGDSYNELVSMLNALDGPVYGPWQGQLPRDYELYPTPHWVALEDMIRGPGRDTRNHPNTRRLLDPAINPQGPAYILANYTLDIYPWLEFLNDYYVIETDFEERFIALRTLPKRWDHGYPRYLYRYDPEAAAAQKSGG